jgi:hypothetical protein
MEAGIPAVALHRNLYQAVMGGITSDFHSECAPAAGMPAGDSCSPIGAITCVDTRIPARDYPTYTAAALGRLEGEIWPMRKSLGIIALLLAVSLSALLSPGVYADTFTDYTITFLGPTGTLFPTSGTIVYDSTPGAVNPFTSFSVSWDGEIFDFAAIANQYNYLAGTQTPAMFNTSVPGCTGAAGYQSLIVAMVACSPDAVWAAQADTSANTASFSILFTGGAYHIPPFVDLECCTIPPPTVSARPGYANGGGGLPLTIVDPPPSVVPEPGTAALVCTGLGLALVMRKRIARRPGLIA